MSTQKIQHRLGNYQVLGLLSYGSTSHVFKIKQIPPQQSFPLQTNSPSQTTTQHITIDMSYHHKSLNCNQQSDSSQQQSCKKDWILKLYNLQRMVNKENEFLEEVKYDILVEMLFLTYLHHPGIVKAKEMLLEYEVAPNQKNGSLDLSNPPNNKKKLTKAGIVMEVCEKGCFNSLINYISRTKSLKENKDKIMKFYLIQVANTLMYLNSQCKILHRDLKAENIMVNKELDIKVIDYGVSKINITFLQKLFYHPQKESIFQLFGFDKNITLKQLHSKIKNHESQRKNLIGSKHYISPELVEKYRSDMELVEQAYQKTDIWSFGVFVYKIFHDKYPFEGRNLRQTLDMIVDQENQPSISPDLPEQVVQLIRKCLKKDYTQRPCWKEIIEMKYFAESHVGDIFDVLSPIVSLIEQNRKEKQSILSNADRILFDQKLTIKYEKEGNKKRRILLIKQKGAAYLKILILKEKQSISLQLTLSDPNNLKVNRQEDYLELHYHNSMCEERIKIVTQSSRELTQKLVEVIFEGFENLQGKTGLVQ